MEETKTKPKYNMWQNSWFMIKLAWTVKEKKVLVLGFLSAALAVGVTLMELYVTPTILSAVERHVPLAELLLTIALFVAGMMLVRAASNYVTSNILFGRLAVRMELVAMLNRKSMTTSYPNLDDDRFNKLMEKAKACTSSNADPAEAFWTTLTELTKNVMGFVFYAGLLTSVQPILLAVILATSVSAYLVSNRMNGYRYRHRDEESEALRHTGYFWETIRSQSSAKDIRIFGLRPWFEELYDKAMDAFTAFQSKAEGVRFWGGFADLVLTFLRNGVAYAYLIGLVLGGGLTVSGFLLTFTAVGGFSAWVSGALGSLTTLHRQSMDLCSLRECLDFEEPFRFEGGARLTPDPGKKYEIRLENVSFRYPGAEDYTLKNIDLTLRPGEKLAVVGLNGAGKTTMIKLLCGFLDPTEGRVLLDGRDVREFDRRDYYAMFSAVFQDFSVLAGTVAANVAQNEDVIDMERVKDCVEKAGLREKVESLPEGYNTLLERTVYENAVELSGGETQRLMLARALYKNAPFIVLDEPTAALDPIAESDMYQRYNEMTGGRSSVYISHRLASTRFCDRIILIQDSGIGEEGTHDELMKRGGRYAGLFEIQSKYYREGAVENEGQEG